MALFDLPAPLFATLDAGLATVLPAVARLAVWAALAGVGTLFLYKWLSPQGRIGEAKRAAREARRALNGFDGEFGDAGPLIRDQFVTAFRHLGLVVIPTLISILPLLALLPHQPQPPPRADPRSSRAIAALSAATARCRLSRGARRAWRVACGVRRVASPGHLT